MRRNQNKKPPKKRTKWEMSATRWRRIGEESEYSDILLTRVSRKPPAYRLEQVSADGVPLYALLVKCPKGIKGYDLRTPDKVQRRFATKKKAMKFFAQLQHENLIPPKGDTEESPEEVSSGLSAPDPDSEAVD